MNEQLALFEQPEPYVPIYLRPNLKAVMAEVVKRNAELYKHE